MTEQARHFFDRLGAEAGAYATVAELAGALHRAPERVAIFDYNRNGQLDFFEFKDFHLYSMNLPQVQREQSDHPPHCLPNSAKPSDCVLDLSDPQSTY